MLPEHSVHLLPTEEALQIPLLPVLNEYRL